MNQAAVGFHCPECVAQGQVNQRQATTLLGGRVPKGDYVTLSLIGINVAIYLIGVVTAASDEFISRFGMWPASIALDAEWWRLVTAAFLHANLLHVGFNMFVLYLLGPSLERVLGHWRFLTLYLLAALGGTVASYTFSPVNTLSVGASGAVFGLMAAILVVGKRFRHDVSQVVFLLGINIVIGFVVPGIDWRAHLGGALVGALVAAVFAYAPRANRVLWQLLGVLAVLAGLTIVLWARTASLQQELLQNALRSLTG